MSEHGPMEAIVRDELVAYLDGELPPDQVRQVEQRIADDPEYRRALRRLEQTWDLLGLLPQPEPSEEFTASTLSMVAVRTVDPGRRTGGLAWLRHVGVGTILALIGLAAFAFVYLREGEQDRELLRDLEVVARLDTYRHIDGLALVEALDREHLFAEPAPLLDEDAPAADSHEAVMPVGLDERRRYVSALEPSRQAELAENRTRLAKLPTAEQERLRALDQGLAESPERERLTAVMERYSAWLRGLPAARRADLQSLAIDQRVVEIRGELERQEEQRFLAEAREQLDANDPRVLREWMQQLIAGQLEQIRAELAKLPAFADRRQDLERTFTFGQERQPAWGVMIAIARSRLTLADLERVVKIEPQAIQELAAKLSPGARETLLGAAPAEQRRLVLSWMRLYAFMRGPGFQEPPNITEEQLRDFLTKMDPDQRRMLEEQVPPERMREELVRRYLWQNRPWFEGRGPGMGPPGMGPPPGIGPPGMEGGPPGPGRGPRGDGPRGDGPPRGDRDGPRGDRDGPRGDRPRGDGPREFDGPGRFEGGRGG